MSPFSESLEVMQLASAEKLGTLFDLLIAAAVALLLIGALFDLEYAGIGLLVVLFACLAKQVASKKAFSQKNPNLLDISVLVVVLVELFVFRSSTYKENSFQALLDALFLYGFYFVIRFHLNRDFQFTTLYFFLSLAALALSSRAFYSFSSQYQSFQALGLNNLSDFRQLISLGAPAGLPTGEWITRFLLLLPFPLILFAKFEKSVLLGPLMWLGVVAACLAALLSFSRGMYIAVFAFVATAGALTLMYRVDSPRRVLLIGLLICTPVVIVLVPLGESALTTVKMFDTTSQMRSYKGRTELWRRSFRIVKDFPLAGAGSYTFPLHGASYSGESDQTVHVGRAFNIFLQVLIEKGAIGLLAYSLLFYSFFRVSLKRLSAEGAAFDKKILIIFVSVCAAAIVRDLSYSSLLNDKGSSILIWFVFADCARRSADSSQPAKRPVAHSRLYHAFAMAMLVVFACAIWKHQSVVKAASEFREFSAQMNKEEYIGAVRPIEEATLLRPDNAQFHAGEGLLRVRMLGQTFQISHFLAPEREPGEGEVGEINLAADSFKRALALNPKDDLYHHNLGWLFVSLGQPEGASACFQRAAEIDPGNELYRISLGLLHEHLDRKEEALNEYLTAVVLSPGIVDSEFFRDLRERFPTRSENLVTEAIRRLEDQLGHLDSPITRAKLGKLYLYKGKFEQSLSMLAEASKHLPRMPLVWFNLGLISEAREDYEEMIRCFNMSTLMDSRGASPLLHLGDHYYREYVRSGWKTDFTSALLDDAMTCYERGIENWLNAPSAHAERASMLYRSVSRPNDDVIPTGFLHYLSPHIDTAKLSSKLSELYKQRGDQQLARRFEEAGKRSFH